MKKIFLIFVFLACADFAHAAPAYVQQCDARWGTGATTETCVFGSSINSGDLLGLMVCWTGAATLTSGFPKDGNSVSFTALDTATNNSTVCDNFYIPNDTGGSTTAAKTMTVTWGAAPGFGEIRVIEFSGVATSSPVDVHGTFNFQNPAPTTTNGVTSSAVTTNSADAVWVTTADTNGTGPNYTAGTSTVAWNGVGTNGQNDYQEYFIQTSSGSITGTFTQDQMQDKPMTAIVAFKPAAGGGGGGSKIATNRVKMNKRLLGIQ